MNQIIWKTKKEYYDIDTGFQISETDAKQNYKPIKKIKNEAYVQNGHGYIKYTIECRRNEQLSLF